MTITWNAFILLSVTWCHVILLLVKLKMYVMKVVVSITGGRGVYLDFAEAIERMGKDKVSEKYGNLFDMYVNV